MLPLLNSKEAAKMLKVSEKTIFNLTKKGELVKTMIGRSVRYFEEDIEKYAKQQKSM